MIRIIAIVLFLAMIEQISTIECFTCPQSQKYHCSMPLNLDAGDESNENEVATHHYDTGFACMSDHSFDPVTQKETMILRGIRRCRKINIPNRRVHCCYTSSCNKQQPPMNIKSITDLSGKTNDFKSNCQLNLPSIILIYSIIIMQYFY